MTPEQFKQVLVNAGRLDPEQMDRDQLLAEVKRLRATDWYETYQQHAGDFDKFLAELLDLLPGATETGSDAYDQIPRAIEALHAEVAQLREQVRIVRIVGEDEKNRAAYEAMDTERRGQESRRAVDNVHLAEVTRERDAALAHVRRLMGHRDQVARAVRSPNLTDAEKLTEIREAFAIVDGERVEAGEGR